MDLIFHKKIIRLKFSSEIAASSSESLNVLREKTFLLVREVLSWPPHRNLLAVILLHDLGAVLVVDIHALLSSHRAALRTFIELAFGDHDFHVDGFVGAGHVLLLLGGAAAVGFHGVEGNLFVHELAVLPRNFFTLLLSGPNLLSVDDLPAGLAVEALLVLAVRDLLHVIDDDLPGHAVLDVGVSRTKGSFGPARLTLIHSLAVLVGICLAFSFRNINAYFLLLPDTVRFVGGSAAPLSLIHVILVGVLRDVRTELLVVEVHRVAGASLEEPAKGLLEEDTRQQEAEALHDDLENEFDDLFYWKRKLN